MANKSRAVSGKPLPRSYDLQAAFGTRFFVTIAVVALAIAPATSSAQDAVYGPLQLYDGSWIATASSGGKPNLIHNDCARVGNYFACQQTVGGKVGALLVFVPREEPGKYYTQAIGTDGRAFGRGNLEIAGVRWTYSSEERDGDTTKYHRTTNAFSGQDRIHYEISESRDGTHWTVTRSGDEVRKK